ncbi:MAG: AMP-binding protein [Pseudomonadota bacterium]|nr:AMP-binding protein [Pseudomonadota bacterium]
MNPSMRDPLTLADLIARSGPGARKIATRDHRLALADFAANSPFGADRDRFAGRCVVLHVKDMAKAAAALIDLDGLARRILMCPPGWDAEKTARGAALIEADALAYDEESPVALKVDVALPVRLPITPRAARAAPRVETEWVLPTSGTSGPPKLAVHTLTTLVGAIVDAPLQQWATFYDIRRYGGLQIFLRALAGQGSLRLSSQDEPIEDFLDRVGAAGVTHMSGTPTHWRKALLSGAAARIAPGYVRLSGEIADDSALRGLAQAFPAARIEHAYASTEAGVAFAVDDGRAGFPSAWLERREPVAMKLVDGALRVKTTRRALRLLGESAPALVDEDGFVDTGDMIEIRGDRCYFTGRRGGVINVGGAKVHPEEVEAVLNGLDGVRLSRVFAKASPITGAIVAAEIVLLTPTNEPRARERDLIAAARKMLPAHMTPARIRFVADLPMTDAGKLRRHG